MNLEEKSKAQRNRKMLPDKFSIGCLFNSFKQRRQLKSQSRTGAGANLTPQRPLTICNSVIDPRALPPPSHKAFHEKRSPPLLMGGKSSSCTTSCSCRALGRSHCTKGTIGTRSHRIAECVW